MAWQNVIKAATNFLNEAITGIVTWSDGEVTWSDSFFTWGSVGIQYTNEPKSLVTERAYLPLGAWLFWFTLEQDTITPIAWNYETKH